MLENHERLLPNNSTESKDDKSSEISKQRMHHITELARLLTSIGKETSDQDKVIKFQAIKRNLANFEDLDRECDFCLFSW